MGSKHHRCDFTLARACLGMLGTMALLGGCAAPSTPQRDPVSVVTLASPSQLAMPSSQIAQFDQSYRGVVDPLRFEFARRDTDLSATTPVTLNATRQWPQHARPNERRIIFRMWEQR